MRNKSIGEEAEKNNNDKKADNDSLCQVDFFR